ncbi:MAG: hypothetical protein Q9173_004610 [Seirophora scorigena]
MALNRMKKPYTDSAFVLVTDSSLYKFRSLGLDAIEKGLLILTSPWMRRLWTLQEGALASKLLFQFRDTAVDIRELWDELVYICSSDVCRLYLALDVILGIQNLRDFFHPFASGGPDLATAVDALQGRSITVPSDKPLLIAGLLQLDTSYLLDGPESSRMQRLWSLMPLAPEGIPMSIIFLHESRLTQPGYRWAPQSFLELQDDAKVSTTTRLSDELTGHFTSLAIHDEGQQKRDYAYAALVASLERRLDAMIETIDEGPVLDALKVYNQHANATSIFKVLIVDFYLGRYASLGTMSPSETRWCVD